MILVLSMKNQNKFFLTNRTSQQTTGRDDAAQNALKGGKLNLKNGINTQTRVNVNGVDVDLVGGRVVNGRFQIRNRRPPPIGAHWHFLEKSANFYAKRKNRRPQ